MFILDILSNNLFMGNNIVIILKLNIFLSKSNKRAASHKTVIFFPAHHAEIPLI